MDTKKIEVRTCGGVYISDADKAAYTRDSYLAMHSVLEIAKRNGVKVRKQSFKTEEECVAKIVKIYNAVMEQVVDYCDGIYPYKKGVKMLKSEKKKKKHGERFDRFKNFSYLSLVENEKQEYLTYKNVFKNE